jgi:hypothetical protein
MLSWREEILPPDACPDARASFRGLALGDAPVLAWGQDVVLFPWVGDRKGVVTGSSPAEDFAGTR